MSKKRIIIVIATLAIVFGIIAVVFPKKITSLFKGNAPESSVMSILLEAQANYESNPMPVQQQDIHQLKQRINNLGILNANINIRSNNQIEIYIPDIDQEQAEHIAKKITLSARLSIHDVHPDHNRSSTAARAHQLAEQVHLRKKIVPTYKALPEYKRDPETRNFLKDQEGNLTVKQYWLIRRKAAINGSSIEFAQASEIQPGITEVTLTEKGGEEMKAFTQKLQLGDFIVTVLNDSVISAATLNATTLGRRFVISGQNTKEQSEELASALNSPLEFDLKVISVTPRP